MSERSRAPRAAVAGAVTLVATFLGLLSWPAPAPAAPAPFWERVARPHHARVEELTARAEAELARPLAPAQRRETAARAEIWLAEALALEPGHFPAAALLGDAFAVQERHAAARDAYRRARALARTAGEEAWCAARQALALTRVGAYDEALAVYEQAARLGADDAAALINAAELAMALGRLDEARLGYREAIRRARSAAAGHDGTRAQVLAHLGLAVAADRAGDARGAREALGVALALDPDLLALRDAADVFFVPEGDVHYYRGLALAAQARRAEAADAFRAYLAARPRDAYRAAAERHLAALAGPVPVRPAAGARPLPVPDGWRERAGAVDQRVRAVAGGDGASGGAPPRAKISRPVKKSPSKGRLRPTGKEREAPASK